MKTRFRLVITGVVALSILVSVIPAYSTVIHVPADQISIQAGVDAAASGDTVLVATGTYHEIIQMKGDVHLRSETGRADCVTIDGGGWTLGGVVQFTDLSGFPLLEGFTITNGGHHGLEIYRTNAVIRNCLITENRTNTYGGGVYCHRGSPAFFDCIISENYAEEMGGGVVASYDPGLAMTDCKIIRNSSGSTSGGLSSNSSSIFTRCEFLDNTVVFSAGGLGLGGQEIFRNCRISGNQALSGAGGGIWCGGAQIFENCNIMDNSATWNGGGVFIDEDNDPTSNLEFLNCTISGNVSSGGDGGGIFSRGNPTFDRCRIWENSTVKGNGGGINNSGSLELMECLVINNSAGHNGGGIYCASSDSTMVTKCTIVGNAAAWMGGGIYSYGSNLLVTQSIIAFSKYSEGIYCYGGSSSVEIGMCDIFGNDGGDQLCGVDIGGNFSRDPLFCDMATGNYFLDQDSPCLIGVDPYYFAIGANGLGDCSVAPVDDSVYAASGALGQNHPNPFNPITTIPFALQKPGRPVLRIFDVAGRQVKTLLHGEQYDAGPGKVTWNGRNDSGKVLPSGVYFYRLDVQDFNETRRLVLMK